MMGLRNQYYQALAFPSTLEMLRNSGNLVVGSLLDFYLSSHTLEVKASCVYKSCKSQKKHQRECMECDTSKVLLKTPCTDSERISPWPPYYQARPCIIHSPRSFWGSSLPWVYPEAIPWAVWDARAYAKIDLFLSFPYYVALAVSLDGRVLDATKPYEFKPGNCAKTVLGYCVLS